MPTPNWIRTRTQEWVTFPSPPGRCTRDLIFDPLPLTGLGAHLEEMAPGFVGCPLHYHYLEEEHLYVLEGTLTVRELGPGYADYREFDVHAGELIAWPAETHIAHQIRNRGETPARYLAVSDKAPTEIAVYPESGKVLLRGCGHGIFTPKGEEVPAPEAHHAAARARAAARAVVPLADAQRPAHVASPEQVAEESLGPRGGFGRSLSRAAGAKSVFVNVHRIPPGKMTARLHAHLADEELVYVLAGAPTLRQIRGQRTARRVPVFDAPEERVALEPGDVVHWAPGDLIAHHVLNETDEDVLLLVIGTDQRHDLCIYPETGEVLSGVLKNLGTLTLTDYWDGET